MKNSIKIIAIIFYINALAVSQTLDLNSIRIAQRQAAKLSNNKTSITKSNKNNDQFVIDEAVNSEKYHVGPGDQLHINIISSNETFDHNLIISPAGNLLIPSAGIINCKDMTLIKLKNEIKRVIKTWNKNVKINVELEGIRQFRVLVTGPFSNAGYFIVTPMTRVSDLFDQIISNHNQKNKDAFKESNDTPYSETFGMRSRIAVDDFYQRKLGMDTEFDNDIDRLSKRNILILRNNDTIDVDLVKFKITGNVEHNPYLMQKDIINIPYKNRFITVQGGVQKPGKYEFRNNDNIIDAIMIAGGLYMDKKIGEIRVTRSKSIQNSETFSLNIEKAKNSKLFPDDHIMVPYFDNKNTHTIVEIIGEIKYPGNYPIISGKTTINDIINEAGGILPNADSSKIYLNNNVIAKIPDRELERILLKEETQRTIEEKAYVKARIRTQKGSLETTLGNTKNMHQLLTNGDIIYIPQFFPYVEIIGAVKSPGRYPFFIEYNSKDYIELAGGISKNASRKRFLIKSTTGQRMKLKTNQNLENGDIIFIPDMLEYNEWYVAKETIAALYQTVLILNVLNTLREKN